MAPIQIRMGSQTNLRWLRVLVYLEVEGHLDSHTSLLLPLHHSDLLDRELIVMRLVIFYKLLFMIGERLLE